MFECEYCKTQFKCRTSVYPHRKICKARIPQDRIEQLEETLREVKNELESVKAKQANVTYNNCTINNNIIVNNFGNENWEQVLNNQKLLDQCLKRKDKGQAELIEYVHFRIPENRNIKYSNRRNMIQVYKDGEWGHQDKDDIKDLMIDRSNQVLSNHLYSNKTRIKKEISESWYEDVVEYAEKIKNNHFNTIVKLKERLEEIIKLQTELQSK